MAWFPVQTKFNDKFSILGFLWDFGVGVNSSPVRISINCTFNRTQQFSSNHIFRWSVSLPFDPFKVNVMVLGNGDKIPDRAKMLDLDVDDVEDIEANMLLPEGVVLQPATFHVKVLAYDLYKLYK